ncbi:MAG: shikimate kinase [Hyphomicrobiaceae bacterium]|nr:shikimate kinase [Hyphomicrobiaceae bacterium]
MIRLSFGRKKTKRDIQQAEAVAKSLGKRSLVLIGLMGCGKSAIGRRLANKLSLPFVDADEEIERVAGMSISDIFAQYGEAHFRDREAKVIARLLGNGPQVLATGGGAFMNEATRQAVAANGISVWLRADLRVLMRRVSRRNTRPLLQTGDPEGVMRQLMSQRYPVYAIADVIVESRDVPHDVIVGEIIAALLASERLERGPPV